MHYSGRLYGLSILVHYSIYVICAVNTFLLGTNVHVNTRKLLIFLQMEANIVCFILVQDKIC